MVVFCFGPLPGERARVRIDAVKPKYAVGSLCEVLEVSADRAAPFCPVFGTCGGCQVQHLAYPAQLEWKTNVVKSALERIGGLAGITVARTIGMREPRAYRNKMSLVVGSGGVLGFYKQRSHDLVPISGCPIVMPQLDSHIATMNRLAADPALEPAFRDSLHIVERTAARTLQTVLTFTTRQQSAAVRAAAPTLMRELPGAAGMTNSFGLSSENAVVGRKHAVVAGQPQIEEEIDGVRYRVSAASFFQVNVEIVRRIFEYMRPALQGAPGVVDLYCGAGTFSLFFAKNGCAVTGVEENPNAVAEARENASLNEVAGAVRFVLGRVEEAVAGPQVSAALRACGIAFLDPPRKGTDETTLRVLAQSGVRAIWYLSCDPATLARDLKFLAANGYAIETVQPFDMFPQTGHVETLVMLRRQK